MPPTDPADDSDGLPEWMGADESPEAPDLSGMLAPVEADPPPAIAIPAPVPPPSVVSPRPPVTQTTGEPFLYGAVVTLGSRVAASDVQVEHDIPAGLKVLATDPAITTSRARTLIWKFGKAAIGTKIPIRIKAVATNAADWSDHGQATFRTSYTTRTSVDVPLVRPAVTLEFAGPDGVEVGAGAAFTLKVRNTGTCPLRNVEVRISATDGLAVLSEEVVAFGVIPVQGETTSTVQVAGRLPGAGGLRGVVTANPEVTEAVEVACAVTIPKLAVTFDGPTQWRVNQDHALRVIVRNEGAAPARMVGLRVTIPTGWNITPEPEGFDALSRVVFAQTDRIEAGAAFELPLTLRPTLPGTEDFAAVAEDTVGECRAELRAKAELSAADSHSILERFVQEVAFDPQSAVADAAAAPTATTQRNPEHSYVVFAVADTEYAFPLNSVREIGRPPVSTPLPGSPDWLVGVANIRGGIVSMVDMRAFLDEEPGMPGQDRRLMVVTAPGGDLSAGLLVDRVRGIRAIPPDEVRMPAAPIVARCSAYMAGVAGMDRRQVVVLVPDRLLLSPEFLPFGSA
ncbi:MAG: chemotaxis protein CheW [Planctomycetes bacterium]|nr:chemotaxis protein CheW [Planctomycetota bacterium]